MQYKLIALDIDGTLLNSEGKITPKVRAAIEKAQEKGCEVVLATGRVYSAMDDINQDLGLDTLSMVCGGAMVYEKGKPVYDNFVDGKLTMEILQWAHDKNIHAQAYLYDDFIYEQENEYAKEYADIFSLKGIEFNNIRQMTQLPTPKVLLIEKAEHVESVIQEAKEHFKERVHVSQSRPTYIEFNNPTASKGEALEWIANSRGLTLENCIAMGDATLDIPMIEMAGLGVAMENANEATKQSADYICPSNDEDGVAHVIEKFILERQ